MDGNDWSVNELEDIANHNADNEFFASLIAYSLLSFGTHFMRATLPIFAVYMIDDRFLSPGEYGLLTNASFIPALFVPIFAGFWLDQFIRPMDRLIFTIGLAVVPIIFQLLFAYSVSGRSFFLAIFSQFCFGVGACSVIAAQRTIIVERFQGKETLVTGSYVAAGAIARMAGQACTAPLVVLLGSYINAMYSIAFLGMITLLFSACWPLLSQYRTKLNSSSIRSNKSSHSNSSHQIVSVIFHSPRNIAHMSPKYTTLYQTIQNENFNEDRQSTNQDINIYSFIASYALGHLGRLRSAIALFPLDFWVFVCVHAVYVTAFHSATNFLPHYLTISFHKNLAVAGRISSLTSLMGSFISPIAGAYIDRIGNQGLLCTAASAIVSFGYVCLLCVSVNPIISVLLISVGQSLIPLVSLTCIAIYSSPSRGTGFGLLEIMDSLFYLTSNLIVGYLYDLSGAYMYSMMLIAALSLSGFVSLLIIDYYQFAGNYRKRSADIFPNAMHVEIIQESDIVL